MRGYMGDSFGSVVRTNYGASMAARAAPRALQSRSGGCPPGSSFQNLPASMGGPQCVGNVRQSNPCGPGQTYIPAVGCTHPLSGFAKHANRYAPEGFGYLGDFGLDDTGLLAAGAEDNVGSASDWASYSSSPPPPPLVSATSGSTDAPGDNLALGTSSAFAQATGAGTSTPAGAGSGVNWTSVITSGETALAQIVGAATGTKATTGAGSTQSGSGGGGSSTGSAVGTLAVVGIGLGALFLLMK